MPDSLLDNSQVGMENAESMFTRQIDGINELVAFAEQMEAIIEFITKFDGFTTPGDILHTADEVLAYDPYET